MVLKQQEKERWWTQSVRSLLKWRDPSGKSLSDIQVQTPTFGLSWCLFTVWNPHRDGYWHCKWFRCDWLLSVNHHSVLAFLSKNGPSCSLWSSLKSDKVEGHFYSVTQDTILTVSPLSTLGSRIPVLAWTITALKHRSALSWILEALLYLWGTHPRLELPSFLATLLEIYKIFKALNVTS